MFRLILLCFAALTSSTTLAATASFMQVSQLKYEVTDLRPDDGADAAVKVSGNYLNLYAARWGSNGPDLIDSIYGADIAPGSGVSAVTQFGRAQAGFDGQTYQTEVFYLAESLNASTFLFNHFRLDPWSRVTFSFDWFGINGYAEEPDFRFLSAVSSAQMSTSIAGQESIYSYATLDGFNEAQAGTMSITLESGDEFLSGFLSMNSFTHSAYVEPPSDGTEVPEPGGIALILAGLAAITALRRRAA